MGSYLNIFFSFNFVSLLKKDYFHMRCAYFILTLHEIRANIRDGWAISRKLAEN